MFHNDTTLRMLAEARQIEALPRPVQPRRARARSEATGWRHLLAHVIVKGHYHQRPALSH
ncbi:MAG TPA: hypothetical protein VFA70_04395 [Dehalococcoidia bacterium]|jgi:hypothetical protein|nr:hypothetical protein [Dehalococcoidia bacterium]